MDLRAWRATRLGRVVRVGLAAAALVALAPLAGGAEDRPAGAENAPAQPGPSSAASAPAAPGAVPAYRQMTNVAVITIHGGIHAVTSMSVERRVKAAIDGGADGLVFEIDSPGGTLAFLEITKLIKAQSVYTIAWINKDAYSAASFIALACDEIVLAPGATVGDAAGIMLTPMGQLMQLKPTERAKITAPVLAEVVESARLNGYDEMLVQGLVTLGVETWQVEDRRTGEQYFLTRDEYVALFGSEPPRSSPRIPSGVSSADEAPDLSSTYADDESLPESTPGKPLGTDDFEPATDIFSPGMLDQVNDSLKTYSTRPDFAKEDASNYVFIGYATDGQALLTMKEADMRLFGFTDPNTVIANDADLEQYVGATNLRRLNRSWSEGFVAFMTQSPWANIIRGLLIVGLLLFMFIEMAAPGTGVFGTLAVVCLVGLVLPAVMINAALWWTVAAIVLGVGLLLLEAFVFPGFTVPGIAGIALLIGGLVGTFAGTGSLFPGAGSGSSGELAWAVATVMIALFATGVGVYFVTRYTHSLPVLNKLVLSDGVSKNAGGPTMLGSMAATPAVSEGPVSVGDEGIVTAPLRPAGTAEFDDRLIDVVSETGFIDAGQRIRVVSVTKYQVSVEALRGGPSTGGSA